MISVQPDYVPFGFNHAGWDYVESYTAMQLRCIELVEAGYTVEQARQQS